MKFNEISYKRADIELVLNNLSELISKLQNATSADEQFNICKEKDKLISSYSTTETIASIRNSIDTRDEFYEKEKEFYDQNEPIITEKLHEFDKVLLASQYRPELEKRMGKIIFTNAELQQKGFSKELIPLMQEENSLSTKYQKLYASAKIPFKGETLTVAQLGKYKLDPDRSVRKAALEAEGNFFDSHKEEFDEIYDKLVKNRTEQAHKLGFKNFVELGYIRMNRNCYDASDVEKFRKQVVEFLVPLCNKIKKTQQQRIGVESIELYDDNFTFKDGNATPKGTPEQLLSYAVKMYGEMSPQTKEFFDMMTNNELLDLVAKEGKGPGGYCTYLNDYKMPFIFSNFNGTSGDVDVLTHEAGHAFAFYEAGKKVDFIELIEPTSEACEVHSMSMEFLATPWYHLFFKEDTKKYEISHAEDSITFIPYGTEVDNFQELVYSNPDWTPAERNEAWAELEKKYRPYLGTKGLPFYGRGAGWQRQLHIYLYPFYYIDYCLAQTVALQIFALYLNDQKAAFDKYLKYTSFGGTKTFVEMVKGAGLISPFDEGCLSSVCTEISKWLDENKID